MDASSVHTAKYLVPNNPLLNKDEVIPHISKEHIEEDFDYSFGTKTPDEQFRDLYWNKIYSINWIAILILIIICLLIVIYKVRIIKSKKRINEIDDNYNYISKLI